MERFSPRHRFMSRRWILALGTAGLAALAAREYRLTPEGFAGGQLDVTEAHRQAVSGEILLIDVRRPDEWRDTGIGQGAYPLDLRRDDFVEALTRLAESDRDRPIAVICARGVRSARVSNDLSEAGFTNIIDVPEGMLGSRAGPGWLGRGLPVTVYEEAS